MSGLKVDADLRWSFVIALAERGLMDKASLSAELLKDNTLTGQLSHATALAALPTADAKSETWKSITTEEISTSQREAKLAGFMRALHRPLLAAYVDPYFDLLLDTWGKKSYEVASKFVSGLYPIYLTTQETLAAKLKPGGRINIATDWQPYAKEIESNFANSKSFNGGVIQRPTWRPLTKFENKGLGKEHLVTDLQYFKN